MYGDEQIALTQTPKGFRPEDARDDAAVSQCTGNPGDNCRPAFTVHYRGGIPLPWSTWSCTSADPCVEVTGAQVAYDFTLDHPGRIAGQPVTAWLKGTSSNWGTDEVNVPDYIFGQQNDAQLTGADQNGLHLASIASVDTSQDVQGVVQSQKATIRGPNVVA